MLDYTTCINSKCDITTLIVNPNVPIDKYDRYINAFRLLEEINVVPNQRDGEHRYLPYEPTSEEATVEQKDEYVGCQINHQTKKGPALVKVVSRQRDPSDTLIGTRNAIPQFNTKIYSVQFDDRHYGQYTTNILAEALTTTYDQDSFDTDFISL